MKAIVALTLTCFVHALGAQDQTAPDPTLAGLLRDAIFAEEAERDLAGAEKAYRELLRRFDSERAYAATATLRLGEVLTARGETAEAEKLYARVLREFADQEAVAEMARARLGDKAEQVAPAGSEAKISKLQKMLDESPDLLDVAVNGMTPLARAAGAGELEVVNYLLGEGASVKGGEVVHKRFGDGKVVWTPLGRAVTGGHLDVVNRLLEEGASLPDGVLHTAVAVGNLAVTRRLLEAGADPNVKFGSSTIIYDPTITRLGAGVRVLNPPAGSEPKKFYTPLEVAAEKGFTAIGTYLLENGVEITEEDGHENALKSAVRRGDVRLASALLERGADPNAHVPILSPVRVSGGSTRTTESLLHIAARGGGAELVKLLIDAGAKIEARGKFEYTPLHDAQEAAVTALLEAGADVHALADGGLTPLFNLRGDTRGVKVRELVAAGADVNHLSEHGYTPILMAAEKGALEGARALVEAGADVKHVAEFGGAIHCRLWPGDPEMLKFLAGAGAGLDVVDSNGRTPLYSATYSYYTKTVALLLELGADPDGPGGDALPPITGVLDELGRKNRGRSSAEKEKEKMESFDQIVRLLGEAGANLDAVGADGRTALFRAAALRLPETVDYLLAKGASSVAGKEPAYEAITNLNTDEVRAMRSKLFVRAQLEAEDRARVLRMVTPGEGRPFLVLRAGAGEGEALPPCSYSLFEVYVFSTVHVSSRGPVKIWRLGQDEPLVVDLHKALNAAEASSDVRLSWGDVVEFTTSAHDGEPRPAISDAAREMLDKHLARTVEFVWRDAEGKESRRQKVSFFPSWERARVGRGWVPGGANGYSIVEGASEVSVLPTLARLGWKDDEGKTAEPAKWVVTRRIAEGETWTFEIAGSGRLEETAIPEDGDVLVLEGRKPAPNRAARAMADHLKQTTNPPRSSEPRRRRVPLPPSPSR